jgi:serine/threonine-protein kinase
MSPEQALGKPVDARTDIYSLGAVMYEMLTGKKPFAARQNEQLLQLIAYKAPPAPHELDPAIPLILSQIAMKAMSKRPEKRYQQAQQMANDLRRYLARQNPRQSPLPAHAQNPLPPAPTQRHGRLAWLGWAALALALAITGATLLR